MLPQYFVISNERIHPKNYRHHHYYVPYHLRLPESAFTQEKTIFWSAALRVCVLTTKSQKKEADTNVK